jgi:BON domain-containing protein
MILSSVVLLCLSAGAFGQGGGMGGTPGGGGRGGGTGTGGGFGGTPTGGGNVGFQGGSATTGGRGGGTTAARSTSNFLNSTFVSPYVTSNYNSSTTATTSSSSSVGQVGSTAASTNIPQAAKFFVTSGFGNPLYTVSTTGGGRGGAAARGSATVRGAGGAGSTSSSENFNAGSAVTPPRMPSYVATVKFPIQAMSGDKLRAVLNVMLDRSATSVPSRKQIALSVDGQAVTLKGQVADTDEKRHVEAMVRMTPGVREVNNELEVLAP